MATRLQKKLARAIINEDPQGKLMNKKDLVVSVGYGELSGEKHAGQIIASKGVREELKVLGFTEIEADSVVSTILHGKKTKEETKLKAAELLYKRLGSLAPEKHDIRKLSIEISKEIAEKNAIDTSTGDNRKEHD